MRLWSLHPRYLDRRALVAVWREGLLAQAVLRGRTRGYTHHPQLDRFRKSRAPVATISAYLRSVHDEATRRGYSFDMSRLARTSTSVDSLTVTRDQLTLEWRHLRAKVIRRDPAWLSELSALRPRAHPLFRSVAGAVEPWERAK